ncbi:Sua5/YciO/YrdC/YwlC family tRNA threonylcarbamoyl adenosine modification protein [Rhinocladiella mackenziei CBS 650.93]|uniref:Threonylcarbamoyl-AMP synthase n=1 Tax=Rhinocladiella mackenziei CBS 650.93 TaxID=1442369 RepID=A0A0D2IL73_9EURO|nr:Sua5/YciO/YrdC/YwlC family tRNA threonylcarbamoyl adenosine modification protein [Rhinocladiella mackenziei CBS 650.93]KIX03956.1 Sua5/YciO/YrdC/YwlC family tRNA threonylcarbamoyl adenosine modification protein [Rhinocladiella mackenziei CBS 650.93]
MDQLIKNREHLASLHYSHCNTRIISLKDLDLPETASEEVYRQIYLKHTQTLHKSQSQSQNASLLRDAVESIKYGIAPPVAFPTETVYGLGADATNEPAISGIFAAKGRPSDNPLIVHVASVAHLERLTGEPLPEIYRSLAQKFWPGPLTILLPVPKDSKFAKNVHPGQPTIGFRIPSSKYARFFIASTDCPIAGPSANSSGKPSPTTAQHVLDDLRGKINFILDGGPCDVGVESTVVDGLHDPPLILRPGGVSQSDLISHGKEFGNRFADTAIGYKRHEHRSTNTSSSSPSPLSTGSSDSHPTHVSVSYEEDMNGAPRAPGMKYRHYAPKGRLVLFGENAVAQGKVEAKLNEIIQSVPCQEDQLNVGIISCHWPPFAGLPVSTSSEPLLTAISTSVYANITSVGKYSPASDSNPISGATPIEKGNLSLVIYNVHIGPDIATLAHLLFGVLRLFDDLNCTFILAETVKRRVPTQEQQHEQRDRDTSTRDIEDAVIDRIEKAAAERVD